MTVTEKKGGEGLTREEEAKIIRAVVDGNTNAFEDLVLEYQKQVYHITLKMTGNEEDAFDLSQETFLKAWQKGGFRKETEKAWLIRVAMNLCHDYHRSRWWKHIDHKASADEMIVAEPDPADREILSIVQDLPFRERQIVILYFWNRMTLDDIAQTLGISQATVFRGLEKAKKLLKLELEGG